MYRRVAIVTDSAACLPERVTDQMGIGVVQIQVRLGDRTDDEARVPVAELVAAMRSGTPVSTAPPDPGAFFWTYSDLAAAGAQAVVSVHVSGALSRTFEAAREAATQARVPVTVVDSGTAGTSLGYAVLAAAAAARAGGDAARVADAARRTAGRCTEVIYVDTLEFLRRGGRVGTAAALLGSAFAVKPLLTVEGGRIVPLERVVGGERALRRAVDVAVRRAGEFEVDVAVEHFDAAERAQSVLDELRGRVPRVRQAMLAPVSSAVGAHVGPGAIGVTVSPV
ncbi:DegV family protein [Actinosynnema pretiosum subsp. pretiosum]|uniref:DegV family protein n=2 Tax=Actinosynnema TaxID=40566 RepID=C6WG95_ACTMD|nr:DegV family protein [Actinosynnema mirum]ACU39859.1 degV family protein [Actinosynnema mirum DSM 43827]AXX33374.1 putative DUF194, DegV family [Actinosynnema pretiosum subsp. pretiosum]QUF02809.1 DegV family protein [Actinosynnema pretiosum subsp. pretiosum]